MQIESSLPRTILSSVPCLTTIYFSGFDGLVVSMLASGTQVRAKKILSMLSFGGEVKPFVPCRSFVACKNPTMTVEVAIVV
jgi:hypothetical protein